MLAASSSVHDPERTCCERSFDHLVGASEQPERDCQGERSSGLEVDDQLDFRGLLHRQVGRLLALENPAGVEADPTIRIRNANEAPPQTDEVYGRLPKILVDSA
jgi:hypothetical protein